MDPLIGPEARRFIITNGLFFPLLFVARLIGFTALEVLRPARTVIYRKVILLRPGRLRRLPGAHLPRRGAITGSICRGNRGRYALWRGPLTAPLL